ncbi:MAG: rod-binding protein [Treponema sp.]|jgi:flagellar protein FlgJ|nr:rod-binding protein [Treponema sp.]
MDISLIDSAARSAEAPFSARAEKGVSAGQGAAGARDFAAVLQKVTNTANITNTADMPNSTNMSKSTKPRIDRTDKLYEQCEALESFLIKNLISAMRGTIQKTNLIDTGFAGEVYEDMLYDEYTKDFTKNAKLGFAEMAYLELTGQRGKALVNRFV